MLKLLSDEIDLQFYRDSNEDLKGLSDEDLVDHYDSFGRSEGRVPSPFACRESFLQMIPEGKPTLELGPFYTPTVSGDNVFYFDVLDQEQLRARARFIGVPDERCPPIDFVSPNGDLSIVHRKFDAVVSSHCIEHQPNLVKHLRDVASILNDEGRYYLLIPDKRYCFDHFLPESSITEILAAHYDNRVFHTTAHILEHYMLTTHNDASRHWNGDHGDAFEQQNRARVEQAFREIDQRRGEYIDVHGWKFTPNSFRSIMIALHSYGLCDLSVDRVYNTVKNSHEFTAVLRKM